MSIDTAGFNASEPRGENELLDVQERLDTMNRNIEEGRSAAIGKTALSAIVAILGIIGAYKTLEKGGNLASPEGIIAGSLALVGATGAEYYRRRINGPGNLQDEVGLRLLKLRRARLMK